MLSRLLLLTSLLIPAQAASAGTVTVLFEARLLEASSRFLNPPGVITGAYSHSSSAQYLDDSYDPGFTLQVSVINEMVLHIGTESITLDEGLVSRFDPIEAVYINRPFLVRNTYQVSMGSVIWPLYVSTPISPDHGPEVEPDGLAQSDGFVNSDTDDLLGGGGGNDDDLVVIPWPTFDVPVVWYPLVSITIREDANQQPWEDTLGDMLPPPIVDPSLATLRIQVANANPFQVVPDTATYEMTSFVVVPEPATILLAALPLLLRRRMMRPNSSPPESASELPSRRSPR